MTQELTKAAQQALEPCPFCGGKNIKVHSYNDAVIGGEPDAFAQCHDCSVTGPNGKTESEASAAWNTRSPSPQQVEASAEYWGNLAQQKADADARRGVSMPVSYYASSIVGTLLALTQRPAAQEVDEREAQELAHNIMLWREDARMHGSEYVPVHVHTLDKLIEQLRGLPAPQQATPDHFPGVGQMLRATPARPDFEAWWSSDGPNTVSPYDAARSGWDAAIAQQATPEPVGEPFGQVTIRRFPNTNQQPHYEFYPWPQSPYLDNVQECHTLYTRPAAAPAVPDGVQRDAERYRWLREQDWFSGLLCVLREPKRVLTRGIGLGADCPSADRLDAAIDAALAAAQAKGGA